MAAISPAMVKELRERTGLGMMDCRNALSEANGDMDAAIDALRKKSALKAAKVATRTAAEGLLGFAASGAGDKAALVEVNIQTDFAAKNEAFVAYVKQVTDRVLATGESDVEKLLAGDLGHERERLVQQIGENITVRRVAYVAAAAGEYVGCYLHSDKKKGTLTLLKGGNADLARDVALHITGVSPPPVVVRPDQVPADLVAKEREIYTAQAADSGKPADIVAKMVEGRVRKFMADVSLLEQGFVKDPDTKISKLLAQAKSECVLFHRLEVGEGIEKKATDFAAEVAATLRGS